MKVLIYKRTHKGDPDHTGIFGIEDCMGKVRNWNFDAVIGIGGKKPWKGHEDIKYKINWIGINPKNIGATPRGRLLAFKHFELYEENGMAIKDNFPNLYKHMCESRKRCVMLKSLPENVDKEVMAIIDSVRESSSSKFYDTNSAISISLRSNSHKKKCSCASKGMHRDRK